MNRGFILLEAIIAILIIAMVSMIALETMQMMSASIARFRASGEAIQARRNALAITRHLGRTQKVAGGTLAYGAYEIRWQARQATPVSFSIMTPAGPSPPYKYAVDRVTVTTSREGRIVDTFDVMITSQPGGP